MHHQLGQTQSAHPTRELLATLSAVDKELIRSELLNAPVTFNPSTTRAFRAALSRLRAEVTPTATRG